VGDGVPPEFQTFANPGQICEFRFTYERFDDGLEFDGVANVVGIIGRAVTDVPQNAVGPTEFDLVRNTYNLDQFDTVNIDSGQSILRNGAPTGATHIGFAAWSIQIVGNVGQFAFSIAPQNGQSIDGLPPLENTLPWLFAARAVSQIGDPCGVTDFGFGSTSTLTATTDGNVSQSERVFASSFSNSREKATTRLTALLPYPTYLPGYTGPALCTPVQGVQTADINAAAIEAAQLNDPLRTCRGCGG